jgi:hypothetical protein
MYSNPTDNGRYIAQAVNRRLPTAAACVRAQVTCGICGGRSITGAVFLRVLRFLLPILIPPTAPHSSSSIIRGWYSRLISGRRTKWTQSHPTPINLKKKKETKPSGYRNNYVPNTNLECGAFPSIRHLTKLQSRN